MNFQDIFPFEEITEIKELSPGYEDHASDVWYIKMPEMERILCDMPAPEYSSFVLADIDPTQFLVDNGVITGLVDTEAYVIAPREFDFVALEYVLDKRSAHFVSKGYETIMPLPDLKPVRVLYRYLYRLLEIQGSPDIDEWLSQPVLFTAQRDKQL